MEKYVIGLDFGTDSVRALIVNAITGDEAGTGVSYYKRWRHGDYCDASRNQFRQHPLDYIEGMTDAILQALQTNDDIARQVAAISVDTTGSTPVAVNDKGVPLSLLPGFEDNPNAMFVLWKDHTAVHEADEINNLARSWGGPDYTKYEGGIYSSEWFWAKVLHVLRKDDAVRQAAHSWLEHCDWIPALLAGEQELKRLRISRCAAGHKAMWHPEWGGLPSDEFLTKLDPLLAGLRSRLYKDTYTSDQVAGALSAEWAEKLGLPQGIPIGVGAFDAHLGAVGGEVKPYYLSKVMGTSTCDMVVVPTGEIGDRLVRGICGQVDGSIIPGMMGLEAGQSAFGDVYAWYKQVLLWPLVHMKQKSTVVSDETMRLLIDEVAEKLIPELTKEAEKIDPAGSGVLALDWLNGRRTPDANQMLTGAIAGISLGTTAPAIFRALVEATAFGSKKIIDRFIEEGVRIDGVIALGGVAKKSPFVMQIVTDVLNLPIEVARHDQTCALGSAMAAAVVAGIHESFEKAQQAMGNGMEKVYHPRPEYVARYRKIYQDYCRLGGYFE